MGSFVFSKDWLGYIRGLTTDEIERALLVNAIVIYKTDGIKPTSCIKPLFNKIKKALDNGMSLEDFNKTQRPAKKEVSYLEQCTALSESMRPYIGQYPSEMLSEFYNYWTEPNASETRARYKREKTWEIGRRLKRWSDNNNGYKCSGISAKERANRVAVEQFSRPMETSMAAQVPNPFGLD